MSKTDVFPDELVEATTTIGSVRYVTLGEDGEYIVFLGHPGRAEVLSATQEIARKDSWGIDPEDMPTAEDLRYTHARHINRCSDHAEPDDGCDVCHMIGQFEEGSWYLDWSAKDKGGAPGYFPVVVIDITG